MEINQATCGELWEKEDDIYKAYVILMFGIALRHLNVGIGHLSMETDSKSVFVSLQSGWIWVTIPLMLVAYYPFHSHSKI